MERRGLGRKGFPVVSFCVYIGHLRRYRKNKNSKVPSTDQSSNLLAAVASSFATMFMASGSAPAWLGLGGVESLVYRAKLKKTSSYPYPLLTHILSLIFFSF